MDNKSDKNNRFVSLAEARTRKAIKTIQLVGNLSNKASYEYSNGDVEKIMAAIEGEVKTVRQRFREKNSDSFTRFSLN